MKRKAIELELRESEERFRAVFENAPIGMIIVNLTGDVLRANRAYTRFIGYSADELAALPTFSYTHPEDRPVSIDRFSQLVSGEISFYKLQKRYLRQDGEIVWGDLTVGLARDPAGQPAYAICQVEDITEHKRIETELAESLRHLESLRARRELVREEETRRIAREIHDELGQRLTALKMGLSVLKLKHTGQASVQTAVAELQDHVENTIGIVRNIAANLRPASLDLGLIPALRWLRDNFERATGLACTMELDTGVKVLDEALAIHLFRIVQESLTNIARHAAADTAEVILRQNDGQLVLVIKDDGCGFAAAEMEAKGVGIGLLGLRERAAMLGGGLFIDSLPGEGTRIFCSIPLDGGGKAR